MPALFAASPLLLLLIGGLSRAGANANTRRVVDGGDGGGEFGEWVASDGESQGAALQFALPPDPSKHIHYCTSQIYLVSTINTRYEYKQNAGHKTPGKSDACCSEQK